MYHSRKQWRELTRSYFPAEKYMKTSHVSERSEDITFDMSWGGFHWVSLKVMSVPPSIGPLSTDNVDKVEHIVTLRIPELPRKVEAGRHVALAGSHKLMTSADVKSTEISPVLRIACGTNALVTTSQPITL